MKATSSLYWWRPFSTPRDIAISSSKYGLAWTRLAKQNGSISNFGDEVSHTFLQELTGKTFSRATAKSAEYLGVGSVLNTAVRAGFDGTVVGSGLRRPLVHGTSLSPVANIVGVRGRLTAESLGLSSDLAIGDPGLLARTVFSSSPVPTGHRRGGVLIPHFEVLNHRNGLKSLKALSNDGWSVVLPNSAPADVARAVSQADFVATSSLHGFIFAHSYGTPTSLVSFDDHSGEPDFKFKDYLSMFSIEPSRMAVRNLTEKSLSTLISDTACETEAIAGQLDPVLNNMFKATEGERR
ncbi:polysaccharide pyruvyl transferase family protein [Arthrobacter sp. HLT1-20]